ncbi:hypothetical protein RBH26_06115 [Natronolimnohabitans sp. A-GB9]|uniref:hypothetical protein n=1 Tax=Natronolimnohabitans sp. A-GB9 TaxID=3069757 RepID=UPI0027B32F92|nr:hypothetical protein [Natronolimnohabitans sp. A-GB9]MDQ2050055.1 hypothetical protein [Natronolimnohabitans sp. A-GB9]
MEYAVSRTGMTTVTLHGGSDTTACDEASDQLAERLEAMAADGPVTDWEIDDATVTEHPTAPFDPYTITVEFSVTVVVDADTEDAAAEIGADAIKEALATAGVDSVTYTSSPAASTA